MKLNFNAYLPKILFGGFLLFLIQSCDKSKGELGTIPTASFTVTPVPGKVNTFALSSKSQNAFRYQWERGDGSSPKAGGTEDTVYFLKKGVYKAKLYAFGRGGMAVDSQNITVAADDPTSLLNNPIFQLLAAKTWKLDPVPTAKAIIVGTEGNPGEYYGGGPLANCQEDDTYRFQSVSSTSFNVVYDAKGSTFNGGNIAPNYSCAADLSFTAPFTFSTVVDGAGIATITIPGFNPPTRFIGTTDVTSNNYRIISITSNTMVLRGGKKNETVFQFKFVGN